MIPQFPIALISFDAIATNHRPKIHVGVFSILPMWTDLNNLYPLD